MTLAAVALLATGCSGTATGSSEHHRDMSKVDDPATIAKAVGCGNQLTAKVDSMAQQEMSCHAGKHRVDISRFADRATLMSFAKLASSFGANCALVNDHWEACSMNRPFMVRVARENGWKLA